MKLYSHQEILFKAMSNPKFFPISLDARRYGKSRANIAYIKFCLKQNLKLIVGSHNQKETIENLRKEFPTAFFELVSDWGVKIIIKNRKELE